MKLSRIASVAALAAAVWLGAGPGCGGTDCPPVECNIEGAPELADEALACAGRAVDAGNGVAYWLLPLSPVVVAETGVLPYVLLAGNTSEAPTAALLSGATAEWFYEAEEGEPLSVKTLEINVAPNIEVGPGHTEYYVGTVGIWGSGVPNLGDTRWVNLRLELNDNGRTATLRVRLPVRAERAPALDGDCWRAISVHREATVRNWAARVTNDLLREQADD
ncbi:MAG: hypothetical protein JXB32_13235 [Deltaproteobacteria bacterium]|nr:hypothetical protein [Deltaproteobacteria bacterium]